MTLLGSTKRKINKDKNSENVLHLEVTKVELIHYDIVNNYYKQDSRVLYAFVPNKSLGQLLNISPKKTFDIKTFFKLLIQNFHILKYRRRF